MPVSPTSMKLRTNSGGGDVDGVVSTGHKDSLTQHIEETIKNHVEGDKAFTTDRHKGEIELTKLVLPHHANHMVRDRT